MAMEPTPVETKSVHHSSVRRNGAKNEKNMSTQKAETTMKDAAALNVANEMK